MSDFHAARHRRCDWSSARPVAAAAALGAAVGVGVALAGSTVVAWAAVGAALLLAAVVVVAGSGHRLFWGFHLFLLAGYAFLSKSFALLGSGGVYVGEVGLALGCLTLLVMAARGHVPATKLHATRDLVLLLLFLVWQAACTLPYLGMYGADALRDAALWGYAAFGLLIWLLVPQRAVDGFSEAFRRLIPAFLVWIAVAWVLRAVVDAGVLSLVSGVALLRIKPGDVGVHLGGVAALLLLRPGKDGRPWRPRTVWLLWALWWAAWLVYGIANRGGMISALLAPAMTVLLRPRSGWHRPLLVVGAAAVVLLASGVEVQLKGKTLSLRQVGMNMASLVGDVDERLDITKEWRLRWWREIVEDSLDQDNYLTGLGYGINLGERYGHRGPDGMLRSPHNVFMTILARSGLPGLVLWVSFLALLFWRLAVSGASRSDGSAGSDRAVWLLAYLVAFVFNASFDVYLEGPMGGIWFWSLVGLSFQLLPASRQRQRTAAPA